MVNTLMTDISILQTHPKINRLIRPTKATIPPSTARDSRISIKPAAMMPNNADSIQTPF
ncbi:MAG TPA: hypothetical protein VFM18_20205 [Methanosarcina sp.]|nr:hypothetical protein [Methanosarcina sp.]